MKEGELPRVGARGGESGVGTWALCAHVPPASFALCANVRRVRSALSLSLRWQRISDGFPGDPHPTGITTSLGGFICSVLLCAGEAGKAAMVLQQITCNFISLLSKQMWSHTVFCRHNGSSIFYCLASAAGLENASPR